MKFLNNEVDNNSEKIFTMDGIIEPKSIIDFLTKSTEEIINLKNQNYILKNNISDFDLTMDLKREQINDYQKENYNLKKIIENYSAEFENKNKILKQMKSKINEMENIYKKNNHDKKMILNIFLRIFKLCPNSKAVNLLNDAFKEESNEKNNNKNENLFNIILDDIQIFENYIVELKDKKLKLGDMKKKGI